MREGGVVEGAEAGRPPGVIGFRIGMMMRDDVVEDLSRTTREVLQDDHGFANKGVQGYMY
jgi:hypothetical protein